MAEVQTTQVNTPTDSATGSTESSASAQAQPATLLAGQEQKATPAGTEQPKAAEQTEQTTKEAAPVAPEKYEFKVEGEELPSSLVESYSAVAKELQLSQEAAQKVLSTVLPAYRAGQAEQQVKAATAWAESSKADKEFGGQSLDANLAVAKQALETFASKELRSLLEQTGLGNHPEVIRLFYRAGKSISQDRLVTGSRNVAAPDDPAKRLFPSMA
jgi:hypothetical protein